MKILVKIKIFFYWLLKRWKLFLLKLEYDDKIYRTDITSYSRLEDYFEQTEGLKSNYEYKKKAIEVNYEASIDFLTTK